jgi:hypothetical protein
VVVSKMDDRTLFHTSVCTVVSSKGGNSKPLVNIIAEAAQSLKDAVFWFMKSQAVDGYCVEGQTAQAMVTQESVEVPEVLVILCRTINIREDKSAVETPDGSV